MVSSVAATARGSVAVVTSAGRLIRVGALEIPALPPSAHSPSLAGGAPVTEFVALAAGETVVGLAAPDAAGAGLVLGTAGGVVKRVAPDYPGSSSEFEVISLKPGDRVVGAVQLTTEDCDLVFISTDAQLLRFPAASVRPQGRAAAGMAGIRLAARATVAWFGVVTRRDRATRRRREARGAVVATVGGQHRRTARNRGGDGEGDPVQRVPGQGQGHRRSALPPVPQGRGHPGAAPGPGPARYGEPPTRASPWTCRPPTAAGTAPASRIRQPLGSLGGLVPPA